MNNEFVSQSELRTNCATTETDCVTRTQKNAIFNCTTRETKIALFFDQVFLLSEEAGKPGKNEQFPGPPGPKGDHGPVGNIRLDHRVLKEPQERGGKGMG